MTDQRHVDPATDRNHDDIVERLLRQSGRRPDVDGTRETRVRAAVEQRWRERVAAQQKVVAFPKRRWLPAIAAAVVLGLAAVMWRTVFPVMHPPIATVEMIRGEVWLTGRPDRTPAALAVGQELAVTSELQTQGNGRIALRLSSGHSLRVDGDSRLELASADRVELRAGAVYLDSGGGAAEKVTVETPFARVFEVGTQFEVRCGAERLHVRVREGRVVVVGGDERHEVAAGRQLVRNSDGKVEISDSSSCGETWSWVGEAAPSFDLDGRQLDHYLRWFSRETGYAVRFEPEEIEKVVSGIQLHGELPAMQPSLTPPVVLPTCGLSAELRGETLVVTKGRHDS